MSVVSLNSLTNLQSRFAADADVGKGKCMRGGGWRTAEVLSKFNHKVGSKFYIPDLKIRV